MISIVTAYYNRKKQFYETLKSIAKSNFNDFEVIVVDDGSLPEHRLEEYLIEFPFLKIIRIEPKDKWYVNSCVPFNIGISAAKGNIIILQCPECLHIHDVITHISERINENNYISISTYAIDENITNKLPELINNTFFIDYFKSLPQKMTGGNTILGWYNHTTYRPVYYHFCSAITRTNMQKLNGFDERFAYGIACEDNEFIARVDRLGLSKIISDDISTIHQWHSATYWALPNATGLRVHNGKLLDMIYQEKIIKVNPNKIII
jgi:glycosyltransferase involved in cell wall biosynthesis